MNVVVRIKLERILKFSKIWPQNFAMFNSFDRELYIDSLIRDCSFMRPTIFVHSNNLGSNDCSFRLICVVWHGIIVSSNKLLLSCFNKQFDVGIPGGGWIFCGFSVEKDVHSYAELVSRDGLATIRELMLAQQYMACILPIGFVSSTITAFRARSETFA